MKKLKYIIVGLALIFAAPAVAQKENKQLEKETLVKKYTIETSDGIMDYSVKVDTKMKNWVTMEKEELSMKEQTRVKDPKQITKMISVMSPDDSNYDNVLYLTYKGSANDAFEIYPTESGFTVNVAGKSLNYKLLDRDYYIDESYIDFFEVNMQDSK